MGEGVAGQGEGGRVMGRGKEGGEGGRGSSTFATVFSSRPCLV